MSVYGFSVNVDGNAMQVMKKVEDAIASMGGKVHSVTTKVKEDMGGIGESIKNVGIAIGAAFAVEKILEFGKEILHITAEFQGFENVIKYSSLSAQDAAANLDYVKDAVHRLHLPIQETYESFSEMQAGFYGTGVEGQKLRDVFEGVAEASATLHLSANSFSHVTFALKEIGELGTLQARQMRMLAFALPGAMNLAAKSMHMSTAQFHEAMAKGEIDSATFLKNFSKELKDHFQGGLGNAANSLISQMNEAKTSITELFLQLGNDLEPVFIKILSGIVAVMNKLKEFWKWIKANADTIRELAIVIGVVVAGLLIYNTVIKLAAIWTALQTWWTGASTAAIILNTLVTEGLSAAWVALTIVFESNPIGWVITLIVALIVAIIALWDHCKVFRQVIGAVFGAIKQEIMTLVHAFMNFAHVLDDLFHGRFKQAFQDGKKMFTDFKNDVTKGMVEAVQKGAEAAGNSKFKFGDFLKFVTGQHGPSSTFGGGGGGTGGMKENAINTSALAGAKGGLGEAKVINIHIDTMQKVVTSDNRQLKARGQDAVEVMLRTLNNIAYSQSSTQ